MSKTIVRFENGKYTASYGIYTVNIYEIMEQYAQAKVLEALEREVPKAFEVNEIEYCNLTMKDDFNKKIHLSLFNQKAKEYYETEVKPKYKQINK